MHQEITLILAPRTALRTSQCDIPFTLVSKQKSDRLLTHRFIYKI